MKTSNKAALFLVGSCALLGLLGVCFLGWFVPNSVVLTDMPVGDDYDVPKTPVQDPPEPEAAPQAGVIEISVFSVPARRKRGPLSGASVRVFQDQEEVTSGTTDDEGIFRTTALAERRYEVRVSAPDHRDRRIPLTSSSQSIDLYKNARAVGRVRLPGEVPIAGARVRIALREGGESEYTPEGAPDPERPSPLVAQSDAEGRFDLSVAPGYPYVLSVELSGYPSVVRDLGVIWPGETMRSEITLRAPATLIGTVPFAVEPDDDVDLRCSPAGKGRITASSRFRIENAQPGPNQVHVWCRTPQGGRLATGSIDVERGRENDMGTLQVAPTRLTFEVSVIGPPPQDARVGLSFASGFVGFAAPRDFPWRSGQKIVLEGLPQNAGSISASMTFRSADGRRGILGIRRLIPNTADHPPVRTIKLEFVPAVALGKLYAALPVPPVVAHEKQMRIVVEEQSDEGVGDVVVLAWRRAPANKLRLVQSLPPGRYRVTVLTESHATESRTVEIKSGERAETHFESWRASTPIRGRIVDSAGRPFDKAIVQVVHDTSIDKERRWTFQFMHVAADGNFSIGWVPPRDDLKIIVKHGKLKVTRAVPTDRSENVEITLE